MRHTQRRWGALLAVVMLVSACGGSGDSGKKWVPLAGTGGRVVWTTLIDSQNRLWAATDEAVVRFERPQSETWKVVLNMMTYGLVEDASGNVWTGTFDHLYKLSGDTATEVAPLPAGVASNYSMAIDSDGRVVVVARGYMRADIYDPATSMWTQVM